MPETLWETARDSLRITEECQTLAESLVISSETAMPVTLGTLQRARNSAWRVVETLWRLSYTLWRVVETLWRLPDYMGTIWRN